MAPSGPRIQKEREACHIAFVSAKKSYEGCRFGIRNNSIIMRASQRHVLLCLAHIVCAHGQTPPIAWRITPSVDTGEMEVSWMVRELQIFASADCSGAPISAATPSIGSSDRTGRLEGHSNAAPAITNGFPVYPDNDVLGNYWASPTNRVAARAEWVGFVATAPAFGQCLRVVQCMGMRNGCARRLVLQSQTAATYNPEGPWVDVIEFDANYGAWTEVQWSAPPSTPPNPPAPPVPTSPPPPSSPVAIDLPIVIGASAAGMVLIIGLLMALLCRKTRTQPDFRKAEKPTSTEMTPGPKMLGSIPTTA